MDRRLSPSDNDAIIGKSFGPYTIIEKLGAGGMGEVYKARHDRLGRFVAVKVLPASRLSDPERKRRFLLEAQSASALNHGNIATIHDVLSFGDREFLVMEYVPGKTLAEMIPAQGLEWKLALRYAIPIADALASAHGIGIVHRDLKPQNVMITGEGVPKLLDFGLAKLTAPISDDSLTQSHVDLGETMEGALVGTLPYMSPEQAEGRRVDARSDVFAFGSLLYEMVTGRRAFTGDSGVATLSAILRDHPKPVSERVGGVPKEVDGIVARCLDKDPERRFQNMVEVKDSLDAIRWQSQSDSGVRVRPPREAPSIAVLPFTNLSSDKDNEYFSDGLAEEIITALARLPGLRVAARTSAFAFRGREQDLPAVAQALHVASVLEGSVRRSGSRVRITVQLIDAAEGFHLWSERYDREMTDIFAVQDEISQKIVETLKVRLTGGAKPAVQQHSSNVEAYNLYLKGRYHYFQWTFEGITKAKECYQRALALDPDYTLALAGAATCDSAFATFGWVAPRQIMNGCRDAFERAAAANDSLAEVHWCLAVILTWYEHDWVRAEREFLRALELEPGYAHAHWAYGELFLGPAGRLDEALAVVKRAIELDPLNVNFIVAQADVHRHRREYDAAIEQCRKAMELASSFYVPYWYLGLLYAHTGKFAKAIVEGETAVELSGRMPWVLGDLGAIYASAGRIEEAGKVLSELLSRSEHAYVSPCSIARVYLGLGDLKEAFVWFDRAIEGRDPSVMWLSTDPAFDALRGDRRYEALIPKLRLK